MENKNVKYGLELVDKPTYITNTKYVEEYLQSKISRLVKHMRDNEKKNVRDVEITLLSDPVGKFYRPFMLIMSRDSAEKGRHGNDKDVSSIYTSDEDNNNFQIHEWLFEFLKTFAYNGQEVKLFDSPEYRRNIGISTVMGQQMKKLSRPKGYSTRNDGKSTHIVMYLDPLKVFTDMVRSYERDAYKGAKEKEKFQIIIKKDSIKDISSGVTEYEIEKIVSRKEYSGDRKRFLKFLSSTLRERK